MHWYGSDCCNHWHNRGHHIREWNNSQSAKCFCGPLFIMSYKSADCDTTLSLPKIIFSALNFWVICWCKTNTNVNQYKTNFQMLFVHWNGFFAVLSHQDRFSTFSCLFVPTNLFTTSLYLMLIIRLLKSKKPSTWPIMSHLPCVDTLDHSALGNSYCPFLIRFFIPGEIGIPWFE